MRDVCSWPVASRTLWRVSDHFCHGDLKALLSALDPKRTFPHSTWICIGHFGNNKSIGTLGGPGLSPYEIAAKSQSQKSMAPEAATHLAPPVASGY